jgi:hypothetical protein
MAGGLGRVNGDPDTTLETTTPPDTKNRTGFKNAPVCRPAGAIRQ